MRTMHVKPAPGLKIRYPDAPDRLLPAEGAEVATSSYWMRRLRDGDVFKVSPGAKARQSAEASAKAERGGK